MVWQAPTTLMAEVNGGGYGSFVQNSLDDPFGLVDKIIESRRKTCVVLRHRATCNYRLTRDDGWANWNPGEVLPVGVPMWPTQSNAGKQHVFTPLED